ncbi:anthranilate synthase component I [Enterovibrio norvegicus FF-162]|uniref:anthranilate synthase component 1 n=1 Tax=Enterovibrio norvegicus TaxID=188144 RepID=UPI0002D7483F|nr:anthranilate synthase component 1 [Enterovibrio norvegicus]OEE79701.1 anthranilate synthase component I [Enterovibrio norvegicus FF-162]
MKNHALKQGELDVLSLDVPYVAAPTELYATVCQDRPYSLLLESAEVDSKQDLKSLMLIDAAVRIVCRGRTVELEAKTKNGRNVLSAVEAELSKQGLDIESSRTHDLLLLHFAQENRTLDEDARLRQPSPFDALRIVQHAFNLDGHPDQALMIGGLFAYDLVAQFEPLPKVERGNNCPDYLFYVAETLLVIDHQRRHATLQGTQFGGSENAETYYDLSRRLQAIKESCINPSPMPKAEVLETSNLTVSVSDKDFCAAVDELKQYVIKGDVFQVVPSRRFTLPCPSPLNAYLKLKQGNPSPYMFYMHDTDFTLFGASPESALKYSKDTNQVEIYPIAGTRPRGKNTDGSINLDLDGRIELELRNDIKENAEHMMLVDLARNDVARISEPGTRYVADLLKVDRYSHVMHLVSRVVGQLRNDLDALHAYQACMNMGTLTGAPKIRAMQLIRQFEKSRRGSYGGAVGYLTGHGDMDTCIVIRSAYVEDGIAQVQAGAGVVFDSIPQAEADETRGKAQAVLTAIQVAHQGEQA